MKTEFPILYKYTSKGQVQQWQIIAEDDNFYTIEGIQGGQLTKSKPTVCTGKNIGRANETTCEMQALSEAAAKHQKKLDSHYNEILQEERSFFEPMLAQDAKESKDLFKVRTFIQPKLDGLRAVNQDNTLKSRNGKEYVATPHLYQDKALLDGELYSHKYHDDFNKIVSLVKKQKPTPEELAESAEKVQFWIYDFPGEFDVFSKRYEALQKHLQKHPNPSFVLVPTYEVFNQDEIDAYHSQFIADGYEGSIIRLDLGRYENKRSKQLLKYKDFVDEEFTIVGAEEGQGGRAGTIGYFIMQHDTNPDQTFKSNIKGDHTYLRQIWNEKDKYMGKRATVKYFARTPKKEDGTGNVPRFPFIIKINREEYE